MSWSSGWGETAIRRVLFIAYYFPPVGGSGVYRSVKFAKHLPRFDWQPLVITTSPASDFLEMDESLLSDIPQEAEVWRVPTPRPRPYKKLVEWGRRLKGMPCLAEVDEQQEFWSGQGTRGQGKPGVINRLLRGLAWPLRVIEKPPVDPQLYWSLRITPLARRLIRHYDVDLIYTSLSPFSTLIAGILLRKSMGIPWVADFRDPWTTNPIVYSHQGFRLALDRGIERAALRLADNVISVNQSAMEVHASMVGDGESEFSVITNGFDPGDFEYRDSEMEQFYRDHERIFAHFGTVTKGSADVLMEAIEQLDSNEEQSVEGFRIYLISRWMDPSDRQRILKSEVERFFCIQDPVPHRQAVKLMKQADVLLLFVEDSPYWKTIHRGKLFEYMASGVPILAIAPDGVATQLIRESGTGRAVHPKDVDSLARVLRRIVEDYEGFRAEYYHPRWDVIQQYDRRRLTKRLVGIFDSLVNES